MAPCLMLARTTLLLTLTEIMPTVNEESFDDNNILEIIDQQLMEVANNNIIDHDNNTEHANKRQRMFDNDINNAHFSMSSATSNDTLIQYDVDASTSESSKMISHYITRCFNL